MSGRQAEAAAQSLHTPSMPEPVPPVPVSTLPATHPSENAPADLFGNIEDTDPPSLPEPSLWEYFDQGDRFDAGSDESPDERMMREVLEAALRKIDDTAGWIRDVERPLQDFGDLDSDSDDSDDDDDDFFDASEGVDTDEGMNHMYATYFKSDLMG